MPEGHTIHRIAADHQSLFADQSLIVTSPQGRFAAGAKRLSGRRLVRTEAFGKHLFYVWPRRTYLHVHLGLYGKFRLHRNPPPEPRGQVRVRMIGYDRAFDLNGPNRCELIDQQQYRQIVERLGPDPLRDDADPGRAWSRISRSRAAIGTLLLDQGVIAGIGNVYRAELLFLTGIHPDRPGNELRRKEFDQLWHLTVELMQMGVRYNRIITRDRKSTGRAPSRLKSGERLWIYKRPVCRRCQADVYYWSLGNRTIYACEECQN